MGLGPPSGAPSPGTAAARSRMTEQVDLEDRLQVDLGAGVAGRDDLRVGGLTRGPASPGLLCGAGCASLAGRI